MKLDKKVFLLIIINWDFWDLFGIDATLRGVVVSFMGLCCCNKKGHFNFLFRPNEVCRTGNIKKGVTQKVLEFVSSQILVQPNLFLQGLLELIEYTWVRSSYDQHTNHRPPPPSKTHWFGQSGNSSTHTCQKKFSMVSYWFLLQCTCSTWWRIIGNTFKIYNCIQLQNMQVLKCF